MDDILLVVALTTASEPVAYICPVCGQPVGEYDPDHDHLADWLEAYQ